MAIYRGPGGSGDAVNDASSETRLAVEARDAALAAQAAAEAAQAAAELAETHAETAETNAETAETNAETAATNAASSASAASSSASSASSSASSASSSASSASTSATNAASSASAASTSASSASTSATNAANSASSASTSATNAASSASSASTSASTATTKASEASTSATNAASSASSASTSASTATTQAGIATTKASEASTSATNAASSASSASTSATNAASSASSASTSATNAASSATAASSAQSAAESARDAALSAYDNFDDRYLGPKSSDPILDNDGNALIAGALYFNTATNVMKVYDGSAWVAAYVSAAGVLLAVNNLSDLNSVSTARTNLGVTATGSDTTYAYRANNLSDLANAATARTNLGLGTAATTNSTDYATAAQGAKADTALQSADIGVSIQGYDADLGAIAALAGTSGLLKKTAANTWSLDTTSYLSGTVGVANGGTGLTSLTAGYIPFGNGTSAFGNSSSLFWDSANSRLGIGTNSPTTKLDIRGSSVGGNFSAISVDNNAAGSGSPANTVSINFSNGGAVKDSITGAVYGDGYLAFATNDNTEKMRLTAAGNLGIGTSSPSGKLNIYGASVVTRLTGTDGTAILRFNDTSSDIAQLAVSGSNTYLDYAGFIALRSGVNGTERLRLDSSGNLGLGVTPSAWGSGYRAIQLAGQGVSLSTLTAASDVYINSNGYHNGTNWIYGNSASAGQYRIEGNAHRWYNAASGTAGTAITFTQAMTLDASGSLGIGVTSVPEALTVKPNGTGANLGLNLVNNASNLSGILFSTNAAPATSYTYIKGDGRSSGFITLSTNDTERMRIDSSGSLWQTINSTTTSAYHKFGDATTAYASIGGYYDSSTTGHLEFYTLNTTYTEKARITATGGFSVGTTADPGAGAIYATGNITAYYSSDRSLKENIKDVDGALSIVSAIGSKTFDWTDEYIASKGGEDGYFVQKSDFGVIAQDVQEVFPQAVRTREDGTLAVDYEKLSTLAFGAIKELLKRVEALEAK